MMYTSILYHAHFETRHDSRIPHSVNDIRKQHWKSLLKLTHNSSCWKNSRFGIWNSRHDFPYDLTSRLFSGHSTTLVALRLQSLQLSAQYWKCGISEYSKRVCYSAYFLGFMCNYCSYKCIDGNLIVLQKQELLLFVFHEVSVYKLQISTSCCDVYSLDEHFIHRVDKFSFGFM
jgi:hypothetical protein